MAQQSASLRTALTLSLPVTPVGVGWCLPPAAMALILLRAGEAVAVGVAVGCAVAVGGVPPSLGSKLVCQ